MNKSNLLIFKIIIPIVFIASLVSVFLPSISLNISEKSIDNISKTISDYNDTEKYSPERTVYEENGKINVYMAVEDNNLSTVEMIDLNSYVSNVDTEKIKAKTNEDKIFIATVNFVQEKYLFIFFLISLIVVFGLISIVLSVLKASKVLSILNFVSAFIYFASALTLRIVQNGTVYNTLNDNSCFSAEFTFFAIMPILFGTIALIFTAIKLIFALNAKATNIQVNNTGYTTNNTTIICNPHIIDEESVGLICGLDGEYMGMQIELKPDIPIIIGRDPKESQLIIKSNKVSRKHCSVMFDKVLKKFIVIDYSFNGTYTKNGERLLKDHKNILVPNSIIVIDKSSFQFKIKY